MPKKKNSNQPLQAGTRVRKRDKGAPGGLLLVSSYPTGVYCGATNVGGALYGTFGINSIWLLRRQYRNFSDWCSHPSLKHQVFANLLPGDCTNTAEPTSAVQRVLTIDHHTPRFVCSAEVSYLPSPVCLFVSQQRNINSRQTPEWPARQKRDRS